MKNLAFDFSGGKGDVLVLDVDIAAFITPEMVRSAAPKGYDLILIPGAITADFVDVEAALLRQLHVPDFIILPLAHVKTPLDV
jgi:hypothetical protein